MAAAVRIKVGAAMDQSFDAVMRKMQDVTTRAHRSVAVSATQSNRTQATEVERSAKAQEAAARRVARVAQAESKRVENQKEREFAKIEKWLESKSRKEIKAEFDAAKAKEQASQRKIRADEAEARSTDRKMEREKRAIERANASGLARVMGEAQREDRARTGAIEGDRRASARRMGRAGSFVANGVVGGVIGAGRMAMGAGKEIARGAGVDMDLGGAARQSGSLETTATNISNSAYMAGQEGPNGRRVDQKTLVAQARQVAKETAYDPTQVLEGLQKFVAKTGDLDSGRAALKDLAVLSKATGTNLEDMVDAAGDVSNALGDTDNKGEKIKAVMTSIAAQGKMGAVEIKDLATQMAKLGAASGTFEGDTQHVLKQMGAFTQMSRAHGGSATATQAATSLTGFANTFSKGQRLEQFKEFGVDVKSKTSGRNLDPMEIVLKALASGASAKHGGIAKLDENMGKMFKDTTAARATRGLEQEFMKQREKALKDGNTEEEAQKIAIQETRKAFEDMSNAIMGTEEIQESFRRAMETSESQAQLMNNEFNKAAGEVTKSLIPAFVQMTPAIVSAIGALGAFANKVTGSKDKADETDEFTNQNNLSNARRNIEKKNKKGEKITQAEADELKVLEEKQKNFIKAKEERQKKLDTDSGAQAMVRGVGMAADIANPIALLSGGHAKTIDKTLGVTESEQTKYKNEQAALERMKAESASTESVLKQIFNQEIRVHVVKDSTQAAQPAVSTTSSGVVGSQ